MNYEPDTVWGRTVTGDGEVAAPRSGLSLSQRRLLTLLGQPRTFASLAVRNKLPAPKLEHELVRLAQLKLVAFQRPGSPQPRTAPRIDLPLPVKAAPATSAHRWPPLPLCILATALGFLTVLLLAM
jgi:hypothetical protein